jgi:predicted nuclease of restriction endonuclease-like (RecB) superfamily
MKPQFINYQRILSNLKEKIRQARIKASLAVNTQLLAIYWEIGRTILDQQETEGWGTKVIDRLATDLKSEFPDMKGLSTRNLKYMRAFAEAYPDFIIGQAPTTQSLITDNQTPGIVQDELALVTSKNDIPIVQVELAQLTWYHHITLIDKIKDNDVRRFYIRETIKNGWTRDVMVHQIDSELHLTQGQITSNFATTIAPEQSELVQQMFKDPYKFDFIYLGLEAKERDLEDALTNQITKFLIELGQWFAFMGRQYKINLGVKEYSFDLLFYHTRLRRYIVIDLKITDFKPEYAGKMNFYLNLADDHLKTANDEPSIGLIFCKTKDGLVAEYALRDTTKSIGIAEYKINKILPENIRGELPTIEELEAEIEKGYEELKSPGEKRLDALKQKLAGLKGEEIKTPVTYPILCELFDKSLMPLFNKLLEKMKEFDDMFVSVDYRWDGPQYYSIRPSNDKPLVNGVITEIDKLGSYWKDEKFININTEHYFLYRFSGFKKAGAEVFDIHLQLNYKTDIYWYGFTLINYNRQQPFLKKLYHEQLTSEEINFICNTAYEYIIDSIENSIDSINKLKE